MIKLYGSLRSSAARCAWFAEELGIPYELVPVDFQKGEHKAAEYLKINPNGKVPAMVDGNFVLWESLAICYYLMEIKQATEFVGVTPQEHAIVNQWCLWSLIHLYGDAFGPLVLQAWRKTPETEQTKKALEVELPRFLQVLEDRLNGREYVALDHFTLADLVVMSAAGSYAFIQYDMSKYPNIQKWMAKITQRPAYKKVMA